MSLQVQITPTRLHFDESPTPSPFGSAKSTKIRGRLNIDQPSPEGSKPLYFLHDDSSVESKNRRPRAREWLSEPVSFKGNDSQVRDESKLLVGLVAKALTAHPGLAVRVEGHTNSACGLDCDGSDENRYCHVLRRIRTKRDRTLDRAGRLRQVDCS